MILLSTFHLKITEFVYDIYESCKYVIRNNIWSLIGYMYYERVSNCEYNC